jgi:predicted regulator of Ras-like GTPase activity (Roadblock/LC7/MglB family)
MTFREILQQLVEGTPGALGAALVATDGIPVDEFARQGADLDLSRLAVEFQAALQASTKASGTLGSGGEELRELVLVTAQRQLLFRPVDDELVLLVALGPDGVLGRARFLAAQLLSDLRAQL